jgi:hypothetical protein
MLNEWKDSDLERAGRPDRVSNATWWDSGTSADICAGVDKLLAAVDAWPQDTISYHPISGPNSNSAAHSVGDAGGFRLLLFGAHLSTMGPIPWME